MSGVRTLIPPIAALVLCSCGTKEVATQDMLDHKFQEMMRGTTLVGRSASLNSDSIGGEERYVIDGVSKLTGDTWMLRTRLQCCGKNELPVPLPVSIKWAGDTPVITLTDLSIPGMGTYSARVVLYRDQYAGIWNGKRGGGQVFGKVVRKQ